MPHVQAHIGDELFKQVKKAAIDSEVTVNDYVKEALVERLKRSEKAEAKGESTDNKP